MASERPTQPKRNGGAWRPAEQLASAADGGSSGAVGSSPGDPVVGAALSRPIAIVSGVAARSLAALPPLRAPAEAQCAAGPLPVKIPQWFATTRECPSEGALTVPRP